MSLFKFGVFRGKIAYFNFALSEFYVDYSSQTDTEADYVTSEDLMAGGDIVLLPESVTEP